MNREIPLAALGIASALVACTDPIIGDWRLSRSSGSINSESAGYDTACGEHSYAYSLTLTDGDLSISDNLRATLDLQGTFEIAFSSEYCGTDQGSYGPYDFSYSGNVFTDGGGDYEIDLSGDTELQMQCDLSGTEDLRCDLESQGESMTVEFERR